MPYITKKSLSELPNAEYVYLLQDVEMTGLYKIGRTNRPKGRVDDFGVKLPFEIEVLRMIPTYDSRKLESELHRKYKHRRTNGEWFDLQENEVLEILSMESLLNAPAKNHDKRLFKSEYLPQEYGHMDEYRICSLSSGHTVGVMIKGLQTSIEWSHSVNSIINDNSGVQIFPDTVVGAYEMAMMLLEAVDFVKQFKEEKVYR